VFVPREQQLSVDQEKSIYDFHENKLDDSGYRQFLSRLSSAIAERLPSGASGLDYGCGPGPLLSTLLSDAGYRMQIYDPFYAPFPQMIQYGYDFITASEVVEHFRKPNQEFQRLFHLLNPGGVLAVMTKLLIDLEAFKNWHYKNDLTHISFFSKPTMHWLADKHYASIDFIGKDVIVFTLL
jgi:2-polyprenyl-3-methyl-5-hydroxy-6-metoxy-1,4-benzoquinol methylase